MVLYFIKKYPFSLTLLLLVVYLSFFKPPTPDISLFEGFDKFVHGCMYAGLSGVLWLEFLLNYRNKALPVRHALIGAVTLPILFGGLIELGQQYLTTYRGGEWLDLLADIGGVALGSLFAWYILRPWMMKRFKKK
jgi:VanZ family protein